MRWFSTFLFLLLSKSAFSDDFYDALGVSRSASQSEIKSAYRRNAMKWHPDRNPSKEAEENFLRITKAYEILSNVKKRKEYDTFGTSNSNSDEFQDKGTFTYQNFDSDILHDVFSSFFQPFKKYKESSNIIEINFRSYRMDYLPASRITPLLLLGYSNVCFSCQRIRPLWSNLADQLRPLGMVVGVANIEEDHALREELRLLHSPSIALVIDKQVTYFMGSHITHEEIVKFIKSCLMTSSPSKSATLPRFLSDNLGTPLFTVIQDLRHWQRFHSEWRDDSRPRALFIDSLNEPSLKSCLAAFRSADLFASAVLHSRMLGAASLLKQFNLDADKESLAIFKEDLEPVYIHSATSLPRAIMDAALLQHSQLSVPRILSPTRFLTLCPPNGIAPSSSFASASEVPKANPTHKRSYRHLCLILLLHSSISRDIGDRWLERYRSAILTIPHTLTSGLNIKHKLPSNFSPILSPAYIFVDKQKSCLEKLASLRCDNVQGGSSSCSHRWDILGDDTVGHLVALWRMSSRVIAVRVLPRGENLHLNEIYPSNASQLDYQQSHILNEHQNRLKSAITDLVLSMPSVLDFVHSLDPQEISKSHTVQNGWNIKYLANMEQLVIDELAAPLWLRVKRRLWQMSKTTFSFAEEFFIDPVNFLLSSSILFTILFILSLYLITTVLFGVSNVSKAGPSDKEIPKNETAHCSTSSGTNPYNMKSSVILLPLTPVTYASLILAAPVGHITVILCSDSSNMGQRMKAQFSNIIWRLSGNTLLVPACLDVIRHPQWLAWFLETATNIPFRSQLEGEHGRRTAITFNPLNCRGTVIALNSRRRYFSIYHPLLPGSCSSRNTNITSHYDEESPVEEILERSPSSNNSLRDRNLSKLLGLESDDSGDQSSNESVDVHTDLPLHERIITERDILSTLDVWLDRLFEGSLRRYHVDAWPKTLSISKDS